MSDTGTPVGLSDTDRDLLLSKIRDVPDWPKPGVVFKDITPLLGDHAAFTIVVDALAAAGQDESGRTAVDAVAGIEGARVHPGRTGRAAARRRIRTGS